jgi:hypothetical protein
MVAFVASPRRSRLVVGTLIALVSGVVAAEGAWIAGARVFGADVAKAEGRGPSPAPAPHPEITVATLALDSPSEAPAAGGGVDRAPGPQRILVFGDSMVINMVQPLADYCKANGHTLMPAIQYGSTTIGWASNSHLDQLVKSDAPTLAIVVVGSSELTTKYVEISERSIQRMLEKLGAIPSIWIGPANWRSDTGINDVMERAVGPERFFRSAELELSREADGIHPTPTGSRKWVEAFVAWSRHSIAPSLFAKPPADPSPHVPALVFPEAYSTPGKPRATEPYFR